MFRHRLQVDFIKCQPLKIAVHVVRDGKKNLADLRVQRVPAVPVVVQTDQPQAGVVRRTVVVVQQIVAAARHQIVANVQPVQVVVQQVVLHTGKVMAQVVVVRQQIAEIVVIVRRMVVVIQRVVHQQVAVVQVVAVLQQAVVVQIPAVRSVMMIAQ